MVDERFVNNMRSKRGLNVSFHCKNVCLLNIKTHKIFNYTYLCHSDLEALSETCLDNRVNSSEIISSVSYSW